MRKGDLFRIGGVKKDAQTDKAKKKRWVVASGKLAGDQQLPNSRDPARHSEDMAWGIHSLRRGPIWQKSLRNTSRVWVIKLILSDTGLSLIP